MITNEQARINAQLSHVSYGGTPPAGYQLAVDNNQRPVVIDHPQTGFHAEIYQKIGGAPPADFKECIFRGLDTKSPYTWEFDAEDVGKMVHYMLRWRHRDESTSAWSETVSATVTG